MIASRESVIDDAVTIIRLQCSLRNALEGLEEMVHYVPPYFQEKWDHQGYIDRAKAALDEVGRS